MLNFMVSPDGELPIQGGTLLKGGHYRLDLGFDWVTIDRMPCFEAIDRCCHQSNLRSHDKLVWQLIDFQCLGKEVRVEIRH